MANLSITRRCRRQCSFCFAQQELSRNLEADMPPEVFDAALRFLARSGVPVARLLGGEPTEHPRFRGFVAQAHERGFHVVVFSGGLVPESALEYMVDLPVERFSLVLNLASPAHDEEALLERHRELCRALGAKVTLGVNIRSSDEDPAFVFDWVTEYGLCRTVRVGMAHPIWGGFNQFFRLRGPRMIPILERLAESGAGIGVDVEFDCGFTPCMFTQRFVDSHAGIFMRSAAHTGVPSTQAKLPGKGASIAGNATDSTAPGPTHPHAPGDRRREVPKDLIEAIGVRCSPVVDILPEGDCIACYALSRFCRVPLPSEGTRNDLVSSFDRMLSPVLPAGVYRECAYCDYRAIGMCGGGCRARRAQRLRPDPLIPLRGQSTGETVHR